MGERQISLAAAGFSPVLGLLPLSSSFATLADYESTAALDMQVCVVPELHCHPIFPSER